MAKRTNALQNNNFINLTQLPLLCEKTGAVALAQPGLMVQAGWQAGWQADWQSGR